MKTRIALFVTLIAVVVGMGVHLARATVTKNILTPATPQPCGGAWNPPCDTPTTAGGSWCCTGRDVA